MREFSYAIIFADYLLLLECLRMLISGAVVVNMRYPTSVCYGR